MTNKEQIIKQLAERYKKICKDPLVGSYTLVVFDNECAKKGFTIDDIKNYIEKEKQEQKVEQTESIKSLKEQLARKTQEYESLEEKYEALKLENEEGYEIVDDLKQECEELKKELRELKLKHTTLQNRYQQLDGATRYRKAPEEIEVTIATYSSKHQYSIANDLYNQILDIINKVKGKNNAA